MSEPTILFERRDAVAVITLNRPQALNSFTRQMHEHATEVLYLEADDHTLIKRFSETRRRHPLSDENTPLGEAIACSTGTFSA